MPEFHDHLPESEGHVSVAELVALRYQQPEGISSDPRHIVKDGGTPGHQP